MPRHTDAVMDDLAKRKPVSYEKFQAAYAWADKKKKARLKQLHPGYARRATKGR